MPTSTLSSYINHASSQWRSAGVYHYGADDMDDANLFVIGKFGHAFGWVGHSKNTSDVMCYGQAAQLH